MGKRVSWVSILLLLVVLVVQPGAVQGAKTASAPAKLGSGDVSTMGSIGGSYTGVVGDIYIGATPPNVSYTKPVLVFAHGYNSSASTWWTDTSYHGVNDMYQYAYNNGYRTAFVNMAPDQDMYYNGSLLNSQIDQIRTYFGVSKVTIIAHSKGGVDANAASYWYGAAPKISRIVTLSSPHWGTPLADLAYSTWTGWLAELFGARNNAVASLQTGNMNYYRSITPTDTIPYYTFSGNKCGPVFSALWYGCMAISGQDDGVVPVWSAYIPGGTHLKDGYWDHDEIKMGSRTWSYFSPYIQTAALTPAVAAEGALLAAAPGQASDAGHGKAAAAPETPGNVILRGGATNSGAVPAFPIESGVRSVAFAFYSSSPLLGVSVTGPDGKAYTVTTASQVPAGEVFAGAWYGTVQVAKPATGAWNLSAAAPETAGFLMVATLDSDLQATLAMGQSIATPGGKQELSAGFKATGRAPKASQARAEVSVSGEAVHGRPAFAAAGSLHKATVAVPAGNAIHNVTVTVVGTMDDGSAFERTLVSSFAAVAPADRGSWKGR